MLGGSSAGETADHPAASYNQTNQLSVEFTQFCKQARTAMGTGTFTVRMSGPFLAVAFRTGTPVRPVLGAISGFVEISGIAGIAGVASADHGKIS